MKTLRRTHLAVALLAVALCARANAQVLDQVPPNCLAVLKVKSLNAVNAKAIKLAATFGLDQMLPDFKDPLASLLTKAQLTAGVNKDGETAIVCMGGEHANKAEPPIIWLVPVSDYQAFVGNFKDATPNGDVTKATSPDDNKPVFIAHWGDFAAVSPQETLVGNKPTGFHLDGLAAKESEARDFTLFANMEQLRSVALPKLKEQRQKILDAVDQQMSKDASSKNFAPLVKAFVGQYLDGVQAFLEQATNGVISMNLSDDGISTGGLVEFKADSDFGKTCAELKGQSTTNLLTGLPDIKYFAFGGFAADPKVLQRIVTQVVDPLAKQLASSGDQGQKFADALTALETLAGAINSSASGIVSPQGALGQEAVFQSINIVNGDAKTILSADRKLLDGFGELLKDAPQSKNAPMTVDFKQDAKTIDGVSLDHYGMQLTLDPNDPKAAQAQQAIGMIYGPNGMGSDFGIVNDNTFISVSGGTDQLISTLIAAAKNPQDPLDAQPGVKAVSAHLPDSRFIEYYVAVDNIVTAVAHYAAGFGFAVKFHLPPNLPPIAMAGSTDGASLRFDMFIPADLVQSLIAAGLEVEQNMQNQGNGGGNPGGL